MRVVIEGHDPPGVEFVSDGVLLTNVHVGVQVRSDADQLVRGDTADPRWVVDVTVVDDGVDFRGPAVHGKRNERFLYLTWGDLDAQGHWVRFRRAKLLFADIDPAVLAAAIVGGELVASISLTDERGGPRCAGPAAGRQVARRRLSRRGRRVGREAAAMVREPGTAERRSGG